MTDDLILRVIKRAAPEMTKIVVTEVDVDFYFSFAAGPCTWTAFSPGTVTRRACDVARYLPVGEYVL